MAGLQDHNPLWSIEGPMVTLRDRMVFEDTFKPPPDSSLRKK